MLLLFSKHRVGFLLHVVLCLGPPIYHSFALLLFLSMLFLHLPYHTEQPFLLLPSSFVLSVLVFSSALQETLYTLYAQNESCIMSLVTSMLNVFENACFMVYSRSYDPSFLACNSLLRSAIHQHHPPQRAVLSQICCFGEHKVVLFLILLDGAEHQAKRNEKEREKYARSFTM